MACPRCGHRKARRECPALRQRICSVCCGSQRLVEIDCPPECPHLTVARAHPPAVVLRQRERDASLLIPALEHLTERQHQLFYLLNLGIVRHAPAPLTRLVDADVADAAAALASTLETASRGVIYEHSPSSPAAQRLTSELTALLAEIRQQGATIYDHEAAVVLRAIERCARETSSAESGDTAYLMVMGRLLQMQGASARAREAPAASSLIIP